MSEFSGGRLVPEDWIHVERYGLATLIADPSSPIAIPETGVEKSLSLPSYWNTWDQGSEGACVGFGSSAAMGITNTRQHYLKTGKSWQHKYEPRWLYQQAQLVDEWASTPPAQGTSVRAGYDVLRTQGHRRVRYGVTQAPNMQDGVAATRWARDVDEIRAAIYSDLAVSIGVDWYRSFQNESIGLVGGERTIMGISGARLGGHCVCLFRMSDKRQAFRLMNSWGQSYPPVWIPYTVMQTLLDSDGEAAVITDR